MYTGYFSKVAHVNEILIFRDAKIKSSMLVLDKFKLAGV